MSVSSKWSSSEELEELEAVSWYHYDLSRHAAEALLLSNGVEGNFLLRNSNKGPNSFALSVRAKDSVKHFHVQRQFGRYSFGFNEFASLQDFCCHLANQPLLGGETGNLIMIRFPYPRQVIEPSIYETVCVHTAMQMGRHENDLIPNAPSSKIISQESWSDAERIADHIAKTTPACTFVLNNIRKIWSSIKSTQTSAEDPELSSLPGQHCHASNRRYFDELGTKEGYLVKQGAIVKNWKQRWFILSRNELKYFKDKMFAEPIRTLDLTACSAVQFDYSQERVNCFCLVFPERTFYLCAKSGAEADEWIKILRWKLSQIKKG